MSIKNRLIIVLAKICSFLIKSTRAGAGATWPGEIALRLNQDILEEIAESGITIIALAGTNGKTTTAKMLEAILKISGKLVRRNESGANLENGIISGFIDDASWLGKLRSDIFVFEIDEAVLPEVLPKINPKLVVLLNLFRDQLDRYGEIDTIADKWLNSFRKIGSRIGMIINADDPYLSYIGSEINGSIEYFGLEKRDLYLPVMQHATDTIYCPRCGQRLTFGGMYFSHLGKWSCGKCGLTHPEVSVKAEDFISPLEGVYNIYNTLASVSAARTLGVNDMIIREALSHFVPAFGRMEDVRYRGKNIRILLSKNPTGFNESLRTFLNSDVKGPLLLVLNDRIPDGTDVSWIWDVDFEMLKEHGYNKSETQIKRIFISGDRYPELALRLKYAGIPVPVDHINSDIRGLVKRIVSETDITETLWVLPTYTAMLEVRKILTGKKIL